MWKNWVILIRALLNVDELLMVIDLPIEYDMV